MAAAERWSKAWFESQLLSEEQQRLRADEYAAVFAQRLRDAERYASFNTIHRRTEPGWWPMKIPFKKGDPQYDRIRYITPDLREIVTAPGFAATKGTWPHRREHLITRLELVTQWTNMGPDSVEVIAQHMYDHRWGVVAVTVGEAERLHEVEKAVGKSGSDRYLKAGITLVYDQLEDQLVDVRSVDPSYPLGGLPSEQ